MAVDSSTTPADDAPGRRHHPRTSRPSADLILLCASVLWALNYSVVRLGVTQVEPLVFPVFRFGAAGLVLLAILWFREGSISVRRADLGRVALTGVLGVTLSQVFMVYALTNTGASNFALLVAATPIATAVLATVVGLERFGWRHWVAAGIGLGGVVLIIAGGPRFSVSSSGRLGDALALGTVLVASASVIPVQPLVRRYSVLRIVTLQMLIGTALLLPLATPALLAQDYTAISSAGWSTLCYSAFFAGIATSLLYFTAIGRIGPSRAALYQYLESLLGVAFAVALLGESVTLIQVVGGVVVIASVVLGRLRGISPSASVGSGLGQPGLGRG